MKHGDKAKRKAASKTSGKKSSKAKISAKSSKAGPVVKAKKQSASSKVQKKTISSSKPGAHGDNGKPRVRLTPDQLTFSNPIVAAAFKRAVKKYPNAFRRLTD
ncbi:MAG TPA: hypothetical protein VGK31_13795 [Thermoanaerobaculia bacterium]|jgi:hypothetical protein